LVGRAFWLAFAVYAGSIVLATYFRAIALTNVLFWTTWAINTGFVHTTTRLSADLSWGTAILVNTCFCIFAAFGSSTDTGATAAIALMRTGSNAGFRAWAAVVSAVRLGTFDVITTIPPLVKFTEWVKSCCLAGIGSKTNEEKEVREERRESGHRGCYFPGTEEC
jgi:hypothetical protein